MSDIAKIKVSVRLRLQGQIMELTIEEAETLRNELDRLLPPKVRNELDRLLPPKVRDDHPPPYRDIPPTAPHFPNVPVTSATYHTSPCPSGGGL